MIRKIFPVMIFLSFSMLVVWSFLFYAPSWGLVDDSQGLLYAKNVWSGNDFLGNFWKAVSDGNRWGVFRPFYFLYVALAYHIFEKTPLLLYILMAIFNMAVLLLWGRMFNRLWIGRTSGRLMDIFVYPLAFFIFTPFWNIFMYISMQQKFIIFFSVIAIYLFHKGYVSGRRIYFVFSVLAILLSAMTHPEGIFLNLAMLMIFPVLFLYGDRDKCVFNFILNLILFAAYLLLTITFQFKGFYASIYKKSLNLGGVSAHFMAAPALIKMIALFSVVYFCFLVVLVAKRKNRFSPIFLIFPLGYICFVAVLVPWGYPNYHLSVLAPFIAGMFFPLYSFINSKKSAVKILLNFSIIFVAFLSLFFIWFPRVSKISDVKKVEQFIVDFEKNKPTDSVYFMAQLAEEACGVIGEVTNTKTVYLHDSVLSQDRLAAASDNFMIFRDECPRVYFDGVEETREIYRNNTWSIFQVGKRAGVRKEFRINFSQNPMERVKSFFKK